MPATLGKYELVKRLAVGGMAEVFLACTKGPDGASKSLVIKRILPQLIGDPDFVSMFLNEARLAAVLNHVNIVQILELGHDGDDYYLAMEFVDGPNLSELTQAATKRGTRLPTAVVLQIVSLACEGLAHAHEWVSATGVHQKLVHRDISPHNILLGRSGTVKLADFGIARAASIPSVTRTGQVKGKLNYMSPEQIREMPLDLRSDVWAMGVTLYEALTGSRPFDGSEDVETLKLILNGEPLPLAKHGVEAATRLQPVMLRALAKDRNERYPSARAFQGDLENVLRGLRAAVLGEELSEVIDRICPVSDSNPWLAQGRVVGAVVTNSIGPQPERTTAPHTPVEHEWPTDEGISPVSADHEWPTHELRSPVADHEWPTREVASPVAADHEWPTHDVTSPVATDHEWPTHEGLPPINLDGPMAGELRQTLVPTAAVSAAAPRGGDQPATDSEGITDVSTRPTLAGTGRLSRTGMAGCLVVSVALLVLLLAYRLSA